jgi:hypothetical protein
MAEEQRGWRFTADGTIHWPSVEFAADVWIAQHAVPMTKRQREEYEAWLAGGKATGNVGQMRARIGGEMLRRGLYPIGSYFGSRAPHSFPVRRRNLPSSARSAA